MDAFVSGAFDNHPPRETHDIGNKWQLTCVCWMRAANEEETYMPVLLLWAVPAVIVVGGVGYYLVHAVH
jgi:hypothetical protein